MTKFLTIKSKIHVCRVQYYSATLDARLTDTFHLPGSVEPDLANITASYFRGTNDRPIRIITVVTTDALVTIPIVRFIKQARLRLMSGTVPPQELYEESFGDAPVVKKRLEICEAKIWCTDPKTGEAFCYTYDIIGNYNHRNRISFLMQNFADDVTLFTNNNRLHWKPVLCESFENSAIDFYVTEQDLLKAATSITAVRPKAKKGETSNG